MAKIIKIKDNIITVSGSEKFRLYDYYTLSKDIKGIVLSAKGKEAVLVALGDPSLVKINSTASLINKKQEFEVKTSHFGKIIDAFGDTIHPYTGKESTGKVLGKSTLFNNSPSIIDRKPLGRPLDTGMLVIDTMIPIGLGQRELIIGDRNTGKTYIGINTIINNKRKVKSIYVAIGQKRSSVINTYNILEQNGALDNTIILYANTDNPAEQLLAPMIGAAMAEGLAYGGEDVLLVIDDLTKHANIYREISLSIERTPGREAYPNDIFYMHSRLLERGGMFGEKYGKGSIAILPIVETVEGDIASLIPSNVISITDGQIFTSTERFNKGEYPAVDVQLSVSRTGSAVQSDIVMQTSKGLKADYSKFSEIKKFAAMSVDMTDDLAEVISRSKQLDKILLQFGNEGYTREEIAIMVYLYKSNTLDGEADIRKIQNVLMKYTKVDPVGKKLLKLIKSGQVREEILIDYVKNAIGPIVDASLGKFNSVISEKEFEYMGGGK